MCTIRQLLQHYLHSPHDFELWLRAKSERYWWSKEDSDYENAIAEWLYDCMMPDEDCKVAYVIGVEVDDNYAAVVVDDDCLITEPLPKWIKDFRAELMKILEGSKPHATRSDCLKAFYHVFPNGV